MRSLSLLCRSQWPRSLRRGSVAIRLVWITGSNPVGGMDFCVL